MIKQFFTLGLFAFSCLVFGQTKNNSTIDYSKVYSYQISGREAYDLVSFDVITDKSNQNVFFSMSPSYFGDLMIKSGKVLKTKFTPFSNTIKVDETSSDYNYYSTIQSLEKSLEYQYKFENQNNQQKIGSYTCDDYVATTNSYDILFDQSVYVCVDTKSETKNLKTMFPNSNIDGLVVSFAVNSNEYPATLQEVKSINQKIDFNFDEQYASNLKKVEAAKAEYESLYGNPDDYVLDSVADAATAAVEYSGSDYSYYSSPICSYYQTDYSNSVEKYLSTFTYETCSLMALDFDYDGKPDITKEQLNKYVTAKISSYPKDLKKSKLLTSKESKDLKKEMQRLWDESKDFTDNSYVNGLVNEAAAVPVPVDYASDYTDEYYPNYESSYKNSDIKNISLAIDNLVENGSQKTIPAYCSDVKSSIPTFDNKELNDILYNYSGQICDLYYIEFGSNVYIKGTVDAVRKSVLEIDKIYPTLNKKDKEKLTNYLNSLD